MHTDLKTALIMFAGLAVGIAWAGAAAAADCLAYIDAQAVHDEAVAEAESVYEEAMAPVTADHRKARANAEAHGAALRREALEARRAAKEARWKAREALRQADKASWDFWYKEKGKYPRMRDLKDWQAVRPEVKRIADSMVAPARAAYEAAERALTEASYRLEDVQAETRQAYAEINTRYEAAC